MIINVVLCTSFFLRCHISFSAGGELKVSAVAKDRRREDAVVSAASLFVIPLTHTGCASKEVADPWRCPRKNGEANASVTTVPLDGPETDSMDRSHQLDKNK